MDRSDLQRTLEGLRTELTKIEDQMARLASERESLVLAISGLEGLVKGAQGAQAASPPPPAPPADQVWAPPPERRRIMRPRRNGAARPRGREAALLVLKDYPGRRMSAGEILEELEERKWMPKTDEPAAVLRTTLRRLEETRNDVVKVADATYVYRPVGRIG